MPSYSWASKLVKMNNSNKSVNSKNMPWPQWHWGGLGWHSVNFRPIWTESWENMGL